MRNLSVLLALALCFYSCSKDPGTSKTETPEPVKQTNVEFNEAAGEYNGLSEGGKTGEFTISLSSGKQTLSITAFDDLYAIPSEFIPSAGRYSYAENCDRFTFISAQYTEENGVREDLVNGRLNLSYNADTQDYNIKAAFKVEDLEDSLSLSYNGKIPFSTDVQLNYSDYSSDVYADYYGDKATGNGIGRYRARFTGDLYQGDYYYDGCNFSSIYASLSEDEHNPVLPSGVYRIGGNGELFTIEAGALNQETKQITGAYWFTAVTVTSTVDQCVLAQYGTVIVKNDGNEYAIYGHFAGEDLRTGQIVDVAFEQHGDFSMTSHIPYSNIDINNDDYSRISSRAYYKGAAYETGAHSFEVTLLYAKSMSDLSGYNITLYLCSPSTDDYTKIPSGTYTFEEGNAEFTGELGYDDSGIMGSQLLVSDLNGGYNQCLMIKEGTLAVSSDEDGNYTFVADLMGEDAASGNLIAIKFNTTVKPRFYNQAR